MTFYTHTPRPSTHPNTRVWTTIAVVSMLLIGCTSTPNATKKSSYHTNNAAKQAIKIYQPLEVKPLYLAQNDDPNKWVTDYQQWYYANNLQQSDSYVQFLKNQRSTVPPLDQLMRSALSYQKCNSSPYSLPYRELWNNMLPTIDLLNELQRRGILYDFEITSGYRDPDLNVCVGGAKASKHMLNAALDIRFLGEQASSYGQYTTKQKLCDFWGAYGGVYNMGLGVYKSGVIHIDTQGWRTWGPDYSTRTSMCVTP